MSANCNYFFCNKDYDRSLVINTYLYIESGCIKRMQRLTFEEKSISVCKCNFGSIDKLYSTLDLTKDVSTFMTPVIIIPALK